MVDYTLDTQVDIRGVNTRRMEDGERQAMHRRLLQGFASTPSLEMAQHVHIRTELTTKLTSAAHGVIVPASLACSGGQSRMPPMEIAKRLVKHEPLKDGWEKHYVQLAPKSDPVGWRPTCSSAAAAG